jgi:hypothetical protein
VANLINTDKYLAALGGEMRAGGGALSSNLKR